MAGSRVTFRNAHLVNPLIGNLQPLQQQWRKLRDKSIVVVLTAGVIAFVAIFGILHIYAINIKTFYVIGLLLGVFLVFLFLALLRGSVALVQNRYDGYRDLEDAPPNGGTKMHNVLSEPTLDASDIQFESFVQDQGRVVNRYSSMFTETLAKDQAKLTEALDLYGQSISDRLNMAGVSLAREFRDRGDELQKRLEAIGEAIGGSLSRQADVAVTTMNASANAIEQRLTSQLSNIIDVLNSTELSVSDTLSQRCGALFKQIEGIRDAFSTTVANSSEEISEHAKDITLALEAKFESASLSAERLIETALERIDSRINARLTDFETRLSAADQKSASEWSDRMDRHLTRVAQASAESLATVSTELEKIGSQSALEAHSAILKGVQEPLQGLTTIAAEIVSRVSEAASEAANSLSRFEVQGQTFSNALAVASEDLSQVISRQLLLTKEMVEHTLANIDSTFETGRSSMTASISETAKQSAELLTSEVKSHQRLAEMRISEATRLLESADRQWTEAISRAATSAGSLLSTRHSDLVRAVEIETERASSRLEGSSLNIIRGIEQLTEAFNSNISSVLSELQNVMEIGNAKMQQDFALPFIQTVTRIESESTALAKATRVLSDSFVQTSANHQSLLRESFVKEANSLTALVTSNADSFRRQFESTISSADEVFLSRGLDVARELATRVDELRRLLADEGHSLLRDFESRGDHLARQVEAVSQRSLGDFERKTTALIALLTRRGDDLLSAMTAAASESARKVSQISHDQDEQVGKVAIGQHRSTHEGTTIFAVGEKANAEGAFGTLGVKDEGRELTAPPL